MRDVKTCYGMPGRRASSRGSRASAFGDQITAATMPVSIGDSNPLLETSMARTATNASLESWASQDLMFSARWAFTR